MTTRNILFRNGPAKSTWTLTQGFESQIQGCNGASGGELLTSWQDWQALLAFFMSMSMLGHHTWLLASCFILFIPGWPSWSFYNTLLWRLAGTTTLIPHNKMLFSIVSWSHIVQCGLQILLATHFWNNITQFLTGICSGSCHHIWFVHWKERNLWQVKQSHITKVTYSPIPRNR